MAKPLHELIAESLDRVKQQADNNIIKSVQMSRVDRERLLEAGWLREIITPWYLFCSPAVKTGESTLWYANYWHFIKLYLQDRFAGNYCLSVESSLDLHCGSTVIPEQVVVMASQGGASVTKLPHNSSIVVYLEKQNFPEQIEQISGINVMPLGIALSKVSAKYFAQQASTAEIALRLIKDPEEIIRPLLGHGLVQAAGRLAGAYRFIQQSEIADRIINMMDIAGFKVAETNPFVQAAPLLSKPFLRSPYAGRIEVMWQDMRTQILDNMPAVEPRKRNIQQQLAEADHLYTQDAYHSLSIEGYAVSQDLINKVRSGNWSPEQDMEDKEQYNALAAHGYYLAFEQVKQTISAMHDVEQPIKVLQQALPEWFIALFRSMVKAGLLPAERLAGFRNHPVYICNSMHVPPPREALADCIDMLFQCLAQESNAFVRSILGHFIFVFIHPYMDGNGRLGRFLMNALLVHGGYHWTIVRVENRKQYFAALEQASVNKDIIPFAEFIAGEKTGSQT